MNFLTQTIKLNRLVTKNTLYQSRRLAILYQDNEKERYCRINDSPPEEKKLTLLQQAKNGYLLLKEETKLLKQEIKSDYTLEQDITKSPNEVKVFWQFNGDPKSLEPWLTTCDSDYNEGYSTCKLELTQEGKGKFSGTLDYRIPKNGQIDCAGFCALQTAKFVKSFQRKKSLNWEMCTHLILYVRGDGRSYTITIGNKGSLNTEWSTLYSYVMYTRGGPYWQYIKLPFSKFVRCSHGHVQDNQYCIDLSNITSIGILASDKIPGPFKLEIDYIGVEHDPGHTEEFAYEMYDMSHVIH